MPGRSKINVILTAGILFLFWVILSGHLDLVHLGMGGISALLIAYLFPVVMIGEKGRSIRQSGLFMFHLFSYIIRLQYEIIKANIEVITIILDPALPISPSVKKFQSDLRSPTALTTFGNSLTLTPGTLTIDIEENGSCYIHYLTRPPEDQKKTQEIADAVIGVFDGGGIWRQS